MKTVDVPSLARAVVESMATLDANQMPALAEAALEILRNNRRNRDIAHLPQLIRRMAKCYGPLEVLVESASPLTETERSHVQSLIEQSSERPVAVDSMENSSLIGGLRIRIGDDRFDYSVRGALRRIPTTFTL